MLIDDARSFDGIEETVAVRALDADAVAGPDVAQRGEVRVAMRADDAVAEVAGHGRAVHVSWGEGEGSAARAGEDDDILVRAAERHPGHRSRVRPGPWPRVRVAGHRPLPSGAQQHLRDPRFPVDQGSATDGRGARDQ